MPFMDEYSTDSDGSSHCSGLSPQSTATDATSVSTYQEYNGCQKRKRKALEALPSKKSRIESYSDGKALRTDLISWTTRSRGLQKDGEVDLSDRLTSSNAEKCARLPTSIWRSVFAYLPPRSLGALLSVNSVFHRVLTGSPKPGAGNIFRKGIHKDSERIWTLARQRHHSHFPRPLHGYRELDMWKLVGSVECQFCSRSLGLPLQFSDYHLGNHLTFQEIPRTEIYWPLAVRTCHGCLGKHFLTESELEPLQRSYLVPSMNHALVKDSPAPGSKIFLRSHMEWLHAETQKIAHDSSPAMVEAWLKTYEMNARKRQRDAIRWERWEAANGRAKLFPKVGTSSSSSSSHRPSPTPPIECLMSNRHPSPARSDSSAMSRKKNRKSNKTQNGASATGANAVPTGGLNHQTQPVLPWNRAPPAFGSPSAPAPPISSFCTSGAASYSYISPRPAPPVVNPFSNSSSSNDNTSSLLDAIKAITRPAGSTGLSASAVQPAAPAQLQPLPSAHQSVTAAPFTQLPPSIHTGAELDASLGAAIASNVQPVQVATAGCEKRQPSIHPEEVTKIESDGPEPCRPTRSIRRDSGISSFGTVEQCQRDGDFEVSRTRYLPESRYRPRSRSPPGDRVRSYRERDYPGIYRVPRQYEYPVQPPAVRYVPHMLYDEYGNEYVCTGRRPTPYVLYEPPPPRGY